MKSMQMKKGNVVKNIPENLIPTYSIMGWEEYKPAEIKERNSFRFKTEKTGTNNSVEE